MAPEGCVLGLPVARMSFAPGLTLCRLLFACYILIM